MTITTRLAGLDDADAIARLIDAMDIHYRGLGNTAGLEATRRMVVRTLADREGTRFFIATRDGDDIGIACCAVVHPGTRLTGMVFLKDLFVTAEARSSGAGEALIAALSVHAHDNGYGRIEFYTDTTNIAAQRFYDRLGAARLEKVVYRIDGATLADLQRRSR
jgi:GNAT superfamily N-acetyltransferase